MSHDPLRDTDRAPAQPSFRMSTAQLGMIAVLVSLGVLFTASLVALAVTRSANHVWRTPDMPPLPRGLFASTALLLGAGVSLEWARRSVRANRHDRLESALWLALAFGIAFLAGQTLNWATLRGFFGPGARTLYAFTFYLLTGLHAAHVAGGLVPLGIAIGRARRRELSSSRHEGLSLCIQYWHFLGVVWLVLLTALYVAA